MILWDHQQRGIEGVIASAAMHRGICLTSPTGGGKTEMICRLIFWAVEQDWPVALYTNRRMLLDQTQRVLSSRGIEFGVRAAGESDSQRLTMPVQLSMIQTEISRVYSREVWTLHNAKLVLVDECHNQCGPTALQVLQDHIESGAVVVGVTATPLDLPSLYTDLVIAGRNSELRKCGAHVVCHTYAPDEPDLRHIGPVKIGEDLTEGQNVKAIMRPGIFGRVYDNLVKLNPDLRPTILFGPDVAGSRWFAEQFTAKGIRAAHIDGEQIWLDGETYPSSREMRDELGRLSAAGELPVVCNRFVLREGVDWPHLYHAVFATVFGSLTSYLQAGGRLLRAHASLNHVQVQDHGGNWHRHGSLNADRDWQLGDTNRMIAAVRAERIRQKKEPEPIVCPSCHRPRVAHIGSDNSKCPYCGHRSERKSRMVVQTDGTLKRVHGDIYRPKRVQLMSDTQKKWDRMYFPSSKSKSNKANTFTQLYERFRREYGYYPPKTLANMPVDEVNWCRKVRDVPRDELRRHEESYS